MLKNIVNDYLLYFFCFILMVSSCKNESESIVSCIIPHPNEEDINSGFFELSENTQIFINSDELKYISQNLQNGIKIHSGLELKTNDNDKSNVISLRLNKELKFTNKESYKLIVNKNKVDIQSINKNGLFYGVQSFLQLIPHQRDSIYKIQCLNISDQPETQIRGILLDVASHFYSIDYIKKLIDVLAVYKMNTLVLHMTDDTGWRIEIKKHPKLTAVGAWREDRRDEEWRTNPKLRKPYPKNKPYYGGYYSQDEIKEIISYASIKYVNIIPEIGFPGRSQALLASYPELSCTGQKRKVVSGQNWGFTEPLCFGNDSTIPFIEDVLSEIFDLFPSKYILLGAAESFTFDAWGKCEKCQNKIKSLKLNNEEDLNKYYIEKLERYIISHGKKVIGTNIYSEFDDNLQPVILNWKNTEEAVNIIDSSEFDVINMSINIAFSNYQAFTDYKSQTENMVSLLFDFYRCNSFLTRIPIKKKSNYIGSISGLWTQFIQTEDLLEYMLLPRLCAFSEALWTKKENKVWQHFINNLSNNYFYLDELNFQYYIPTPEGASDDILFKGESKKIWLSAPVEEAIIHYTLDDSEPTYESNIYSTPVSISSSCVLKAKTFLPNGKSSRTIVARYAQEPTKPAIEDPVNLYPGLTQLAKFSRI